MAIRTVAEMSGGLLRYERKQLFFAHGHNRGHGSLILLDLFEINSVVKNRAFETEALATGKCRNADGQSYYHS